jgi:hypothetical protein
MAYVFPGGNLVWKPIDIVALLCTKMASTDNRPAVGCAVILAESAGDPLATGRAIWNPGAPTHLSIDLGLFQLNSYYTTVTGHYPDVPPITLAATFDPIQSWDYAWKLLNKTRPDTWHYNWNAWTAFKSGTYDKFLPGSIAALEQYRVLPA